MNDELPTYEQSNSDVTILPSRSSALFDSLIDLPSYTEYSHSCITLYIKWSRTCAIYVYNDRKDKIMYKLNIISDSKMELVDSTPSENLIATILVQNHNLFKIIGRNDGFNMNQKGLLNKKVSLNVN